MTMQLQNQPSGSEIKKKKKRPFRMWHAHSNIFDFEEKNVISRVHGILFFLGGSLGWFQVKTFVFLPPILCSPELYFVKM